MTPPTNPRVDSMAMVISTHDRRDDLVRAIDSVLAQMPGFDEVVVVNNGDPRSMTDIRARYQTLPTVRFVDTPHRGLGESRNVGARLVRSEWIAFLDDDDQLEPTWTRIMVDNMGPATGLISCSARFITRDGVTVKDDLATEPIEMLGAVIGSHYAGCFLVRRTLFDRAGGYLRGLPCSHQTELWIRMATVADEQGLTITSDGRYGTIIESRDAADRPLSNHRLIYDGGRWVLTRHRSHFDRLRGDLANLYGSTAVNAVRLGEHRSARRRSRIALRIQPLSPSRWLRALASGVPAVSARLWPGGHRDESAVTANGLDLVAQLADDDSSSGGAVDEDLLFLPWRYRVNEPRSADQDQTPFWEHGLAGNDVRYQDPVYRWAARTIRAGRHGLGPNPSVVDIGTGSGHKLVRHIAPLTDDLVGVDQPSGISIASRTFPDRTWISGDLGADGMWTQLGSYSPDLVICADVIEHVVDPWELLTRLRGLAGPHGLILISTPDRSRLDDVDPLGPPRNPRHVREWSFEEFELLLEAAGLRILDTRHLLPRRYSPTIADLRRTLGRLRRRMPVPDARSSMAFLVRSRAVEPGSDPMTGPDPMTRNGPVAES